MTTADASKVKVYTHYERNGTGPNEARWLATVSFPTLTLGNVTKVGLPRSSKVEAEAAAAEAALADSEVFPPKAPAPAQKARPEKKANVTTPKSQEAKPSTNVSKEEPTPRSARDLSQFEIGQTLKGKIEKALGKKTGVILKVGQVDGLWLPYEEMRDGFPSRTKLSELRGSVVSLRVLGKDDGYLVVTNRTGDLNRPLPAKSPLNGNDVSELANTPPDVWLEGEVVRMYGNAPPRALVKVQTPGGKGAVAPVYDTEFTPAFRDEAIIGGKVRVRVLSVNTNRTKVKLSMLDPGSKPKPEAKEAGDAPPAPTTEQAAPSPPPEEASSFFGGLFR